MADQGQETQKYTNSSKDSILKRCYEEPATNSGNDGFKLEQKINTSLRSLSTVNSLQVIRRTSSQEQRRSSISSTDSDYSWVFDSDSALSDPEVSFKEATVRRIGKCRTKIMKKSPPCQECGHHRSSSVGNDESMTTDDETPRPLPVKTPQPASIMKNHQSSKSRKFSSLKIGLAKSAQKATPGSSKSRVTRQVTFNLPDSSSSNTTSQEEHSVRPNLMPLQKGKSFPIAGSASMFIQLESMNNLFGNFASQPTNWTVVSALDNRHKIEEPSRRKRSRWIVLLAVFALCMLGVTAATASLVYIKGLRNSGSTCPLTTTVAEATRNGLNYAKEMFSDYTKSNETLPDVDKCKNIEDLKEKKMCLQNIRSEIVKRPRDSKHLPPLLLKNLQRTSWKGKTAADLATNIKNILTHNLKGRDEVIMQTDEETALVVIIKRKPKE